MPLPRSADPCRLPATALHSVVAMFALSMLVACSPADESGEAATRIAAGDVDNGPVLLVSMDGLNEDILRRTLSPSQAPTFHQVLDQGRCAEYVVPSFPSLTAASHAAIWNGAWGTVTGLTGNALHRLPRSAHSLLELRSGFSYAPLAAEPMWITAARHGLRVGGHHPTQAPFPAGFPPTHDDWTPTEAEARRTEQRRILDQANIMVFNGYNQRPVNEGVLRLADMTATDATAWEGVDALPAAGPPPRAFTWETPLGDLHALLHGDGDTYRRLSIATRPALAEAVVVEVHPAEAEATGDRELARFFSAPLRLRSTGGEPVAMRFRLFELADDGSDFLLYHPAVHVAEANRPEVQQAYETGAPGWFGNSSMGLWARGAFGPRFDEGGDGTAELRMLETAELVTEVFNAGSRWLWATLEPELMIDYFPLPDTVDHYLLGFLDQRWPGYDDDLAARIGELRARLWALADLRLALLRDLVAAADGRLVLIGDHGMRATWQFLHLNVALRDAGLLVLDADGDIDLARSRAVSPNGYWITINTTDWREGIVPPQERRAVIDEVAAALQAIVDSAGEPVVTRVYVAEEHPELGLGGAAGGDVYWRLAPGYRTTSSLRGGEAITPARIWAGHGFDSTEPDMHTVFCEWGSGVTPGRTPAMRVIDIAPRLGSWLGFGSPQDATGEP
ncbi:MAG: alkaline phosphatase family protein [Gammaproteobacteria bacterium]|nr:alkaline phosphatase family protein [Gammaproteobacteria bacterium]